MVSGTNSGVSRFLTILIVMLMLFGGLPAPGASPRALAQDSGGGPDIGEPPDVVESIWPGTTTDSFTLAAVPASVDLSSRDASRAFYNSYFRATMPPVGWSGSYATCTPGTSSAAYKQAILDQIVWYRAMAGVPADVTLSNTFNLKAQQTALMMGKANNLSHYPGADWLC